MSIIRPTADYCLCGGKVIELNLENFLGEIDEYIDCIGRSEDRVFTKKVVQFIQFIRHLRRQEIHYLSYCKKCAVIQSTSAVSGQNILKPKFVGV